MNTVGSVALVIGQRYRARLLIKAPKLVAGESRVRSELEGEGFRQIVFYDKDALPADWPSDQRSDPSGFSSWTAYLEGVYTGEGAGGGTGIDANENVQLYGFWPYGVSAAPPQPYTPPVLPPVLVPPVAPQAEWRETAGSAALLGVAFVAAYILQSRWLRGRA